MTNEKQNLADWEAAVPRRGAFSLKIKKALHRRGILWKSDFSCPLTDEHPSRRAGSSVAEIDPGRQQNEGEYMSNHSSYMRMRSRS
jgi:hypothetical protein